jgi:hypothetical protein
VLFKSHHLSASDIRKSFRLLDGEHRGKQADSGTGYVVEWRKRRYPPKAILEMATGVSRKQFSGGEVTNSIFRKLGFKVGDDSEWPRIEAPCSSMPMLVDEVFHQHWTRFEINGNGAVLNDGGYPGVYVLAYTASELEGKRVREKDIYYVGMSLVGVRTRLGQFRAGLLDGHHHCAAKHFFFDENRGKPFDEATSQKKFFVATVSIPCRFRKQERTPADLQKLGTVAALEFHVLARVKEKQGKEPPLNKK